MTAELRPLRTPKFDWEEARRMYAAGITRRRIAELLGVSKAAVDRVCNTKNLVRSRAYSQARGVVHNPTLRTLCECGRRQRWNGAPCRLCYAESRITTVRDNTLYCSRCQEWKPDAEFSTNRSHPHRRHRCDWCCECDAAAKREYRRRLRTES